MKKNIPHDALFKELLTSQPMAQEFLEHYLPHPLKEQVNCSEVQVEKETFVNKNLEKRLSDVLLSVRMRNQEKAFVYVLIEHQSYSDHWIALRLLHYVILLCERLKKKCNKLPLICPIVVYNGKDAYQAPRSFWKLFTDPQLAQQLLGGDYPFVDLQSIADEQIRKKYLLKLLEYFMKYIHTTDLLEVWKVGFESFGLSTPFLGKGSIYLMAFLRYTEVKLSEEKRADLKALLAQHLSQKGEEVMRTIAQAYIEEGKAEGIALGEARGEAKGIALGEARGIALGEARGIEKVAQAMIAKGRPIEEIIEFTRLTLAQVKELQDTKKF